MYEACCKQAERLLEERVDFTLGGLGLRSLANLGSIYLGLTLGSWRFTVCKTVRELRRVAEPHGIRVEPRTWQSPGSKPFVLLTAFQRQVFARCRGRWADDFVVSRSFWLACLSGRTNAARKPKRHREKG